MSYVNIPNYGLGGGGRNGLWARSDAVGSMTVSNSTMVEYLNDSSTFTFNFVTSNIPVTVQTSPSGLSFTVDGTNYSSAQAFNWLYGRATDRDNSPQSGGPALNTSGVHGMTAAPRRIGHGEHQLHRHGEFHDAVLPDHECQRRWSRQSRPAVGSTAMPW